jgi:hypothetical protein
VNEVDAERDRATPAFEMRSKRLLLFYGFSKLEELCLHPPTHPPTNCTREDHTCTNAQTRTHAPMHTHTHTHITHTHTHTHTHTQDSEVKAVGELFGCFALETIIAKPLFAMPHKRCYHELEPEPCPLSHYHFQRSFYVYCHVQ